MTDASRFTTLQEAWLDLARRGDHTMLARIFAYTNDPAFVNLRGSGRSFFLQELAAAYDEKQKS